MSALQDLLNWSDMHYTTEPRLLSAKARIEYEAYRAALKAGRQCAAEAMLPYTALLMDAESRKWIAPEIWMAIEAAAKSCAAALSQIDALLKE